MRQECQDTVGVKPEPSEPNDVIKLGGSISSDVSEVTRECVCVAAAAAAAGCEQSTAAARVTRFGVQVCVRSLQSVKSINSVVCVRWHTE